MTEQILAKIATLNEVLKKNLLLQQPIFEEMQQQLQTITHNITNQKASIAVVAAMKAGKSTFLNALIGQDLLPNETDACTTAITEIYHHSTQSKAYTKHLTNGTEQTQSFETLDQLYKAFHEDVRANRRLNDTSVAKYTVKAPIHSLAARANTVEQFVLIDTPGPNEASSASFNATGLREVAYRQLRIADAVIIILDYTNMKSDINAQLISDLFSGNTYIQNNPEGIFFILNKIDQQNNKDASLQQAIQEAKAFITHQSGGILKQPNVFAVSALKALLARMLVDENLQQQALALVEERFGTHYAEKVEMNGKVFLALPEPEQLAQALLKDSHIEEFEQAVLQRQFNEASNNLAHTTAKKLVFMTETIQQHVATVKHLLTVEAQQFKANLQQAEQSVAALQRDIDQMLTDFELRVNIYENDMKLELANQTELTSLLTNVLSQYDQNIAAQQEEGLKKQLDLIYQEAFQVALNWQLRKKDQLIRTFNTFQMENLKMQQQSLAAISQNAAQTIEQHIAFEMPALRQFGELQMLEQRKFDPHIHSVQPPADSSNAPNILTVVETIVDVFGKQKSMGGVDDLVKTFSAVGNVSKFPASSIDVNAGKMEHIIDAPKLQTGGGAKGGMDLLVWLPIAEQVIQLFMTMTAKKPASTYYVSKFEIQDEILHHYVQTMQQWQQQLTQFVDQFKAASKQDIELTAGKFIRSFVDYLQKMQQEVETLQQNQHETLAQIEQIEAVL